LIVGREAQPDIGDRLQRLERRWQRLHGNTQHGAGIGLRAGNARQQGRGGEGAKQLAAALRHGGLRESSRATEAAAGSAI